MSVDWSEYARRGLKIYREAETNFNATSSNRRVSWWIADISTTDSPFSSVLHQWCKSQEQKGKVHMFPNIAMGNGSVLWIMSGDVVEFHANAERLGLTGLIHRTEEVFG
jgi:hypothetical protein